MRRRRTAHRFKEKHRTSDVMIEEKVDFAGLMLSTDVLEGLKSAGFERPSPIQLKAIPLGRCGLDLIAQAKSGTGKTCVFSVIALENINLSVLSIQVLVLAPTREIAVQIKDVISSIGVHMKGLHANVFIGGMPFDDDKANLKQCHIAIGTPGRVKHLIETKLLQTTSIRLFILDEADKLLEENFQDQINWIYSTLPSSKQMLALSATYPDHLAEQLKNYMKEPTFVRLNAADPALEGIQHYHCVVPFHSLPHKVFQEKVQSLLQLLSKLSFHQCLIFSNYQIRAKSLSETLAKNGWPSTYISGNQGQNERLSAMAKLKEFKCRILISTDLTSRGIDAERVNLVINMDLPHDSETYLHRVGRAGRFGSFGVTINFVAEGKEVTSLNEIEANCGVTITPLPDDVSKLLSDEMMHASLQNSLPKQEVTLLNIRESEDMVCKVDHKMISNQNVKHVEKQNGDVLGTNGNVGNLKSDCPETENKNEEGTNVNGKVRVESQLTNNKKDADMTVGHNQAEYIQNEDMSIKNTKEGAKFPNEKILMENTREERDGQQASVVKDNKRHDKEISAADPMNEAIKESFVAEHQYQDKGMEYSEKERVCLQGDGGIHTDVGIENEERKNKAKDAGNVLEMSNVQREHEVMKDEHADCTITSGNQKIIFRNHKAGLFSEAEQFNDEDCVSDDYESELSSSEETGSSEQSTDSYVSSSDSHVPISCKDFDNVLDSYLKGGSCIEENDLESESRTLGQFLTSKGAEDANSGNPTGASSDGIYSNETRLPNGKYANRSPVSKDADGGQSIGAQGGVIYADESRASPTMQNPKTQRHGIYGNEPSRKFSTEANDRLNSEETMFYGATSDDVTVYMAALPTEWTNTWYRVYDRQTNFIMKYTKFCQGNF